MWELDHKEGWALKNWCFWSVVLKKTLVSPLDSKEIKSVNFKGNQSWIFIGRTDVEAETPILWPPDAKSWLIGKDPDAGKDWRWEKGMTEDEMVGWHCRLDGHEFECTPGVDEGQGGLACCDSWGHNESESRSVVSDSLRPHESKHTRPPRPSPTPGIHSDSRPSSPWCHPTISSSVVPFSSHLKSFPASVSFPMSQFFASSGQSIGASA